MVPSLAHERHPMDMEHHWLLAHKAFTATTGLTTVDSTQKRIAKRLSYSNKEPLLRLKRTVMVRAKRHLSSVPAPAIINSVIDNTRRLPHTIAPSIRSHIFDLVHRTLRTKHNLRYITNSGVGCVLCGEAVEEDLAHLFTGCQAIQMCLYSFTSTGDAKLREAAEILRGATLADHTLETPGLAIDTMLTLLCFSKAVWRSRWTFRDNQVAPLKTAVSTTITSWFQRYWRSTDFQ